MRANVQKCVHKTVILERLKRNDTVGLKEKEAS